MQKKVRQLVEYILPYEPERLYLFGSWARGEEDELSDVDMVVIKKTDTPFLERLREVAHLLPRDVGGVDILVYTPDEFISMEREGNAFVEMILEEGHLIYENEAKS
jgi:predicted nucleotidyltransferase